MRKTALLFLASVVAACSGHADESVGRSTAAIIGGTVSNSDQDAVVLLGIRSNGVITGLCTGTLIASNLVVTARHCVGETDGVSLCTKDGAALSGGTVRSESLADELIVYIGPLAAQGYANVSNAVAAGQELVHENTAITCNSDIAFIVLTRDVAAPIAKARTTAAVVGEPLTVVGYGVTDNGQLATQRLQRGGVVITDVGPKVLDATTSAGLGTAEFQVGESVCAGDSGGPAFAASGELVGVVARGGNGMTDPNDAAKDCTGATTTNVYTSLAAKPDLLAEALAHAQTAHDNAAASDDPANRCTVSPRTTHPLSAAGWAVALVALTAAWRRRTAR